jgi:uncharacterized lipoprotein YddW (UPF0748 family)
MLRAAALVIAVVVCVGAGLAGAPALSAARSTPTPTPTPAPTRVPTPSATPVPAASPTRVPATALPTPTLPVAPTATSLPTAAPAAAIGELDPPELRAVWVDAFHDGFKTPEQVDHLVAWARSANLNALFVEVRRRGDAYYLKSFEPRSEDPDLVPGFDALQYLIDRAHQGPQRLQVHAWLATLPIWHQHTTPPQAPNHVFNLHGPNADPANTWLMQRDDGETWAGQGDSGIYYLDPGNPAVVRYTTDVYLNVVRQYDVDGIHLDQVRYFEGDALRWGYNPTSVARFNTQLGRDPDSQPAPNDPYWIAWRREQVTNLVQRIYLEAKAIKPSIAVTAAVVTWGKGPQSADDWQSQAPFASVLQDWRAWLQEGIVDYLLPMDYYREGGPQAAWFDTWTQWQAANVGRRAVVLGLGAYLNAGDDVLAQLGRARELRPLGVALYSYAVPTRDLEDASQADRDAFAVQLRALFPRPAPVPELAWLSHPAQGGVLVELPGLDDRAVVLEDPFGQRRTWRTDGTGTAGSFDLAPGHYRLSVRDPRVDATPIELDVTPGRVTSVRYAVAARARN